MTIAYPLNRLPRPLADGYGLTPMSAVVRTDMDNGFARMRRRYSCAPTQATLNWNMRAEDFGLFDSWWRSVLLDGASWFLMPLRNGTSDTLWNVRGVQPPEAELQTVDVYRVSWRVEIEQVSFLSADDLAALLANQADNLDASVLSIHQFVHVDYPAASLQIGP